MFYTESSLHWRLCRRIFHLISSFHFVLWGETLQTAGTLISSGPLGCSGASLELSISGEGAMSLERQLLKQISAHEKKMLYGAYACLIKIAICILLKISPSCSVLPAASEVAREQMKPPTWPPLLNNWTDCGTYSVNYPGWLLSPVREHIAG